MEHNQSDQLRADQLTELDAAPTEPVRIARTLNRNGHGASNGHMHLLAAEGIALCGKQTTVPVPHLEAEDMAPIKLGMVTCPRCKQLGCI